MSRRESLIVAAFWVCASAVAARVDGPRDLQKRLGLSDYHASEQLSLVKVGVLAEGFQGFDPDASLLPSTARLAFPERGLGDNAHGLAMAQVLWAGTGNSPKGPEFHLVQYQGLSAFKAGIDYLIKHKIDLVIFSSNWTFGSNFDGKGFINREVNRAIDAGMIWLNAAGNHHLQTFAGSVLPLTRQDAVRNPFNEDGRFYFLNNYDDAQIEVTLSWNDFPEEDYQGKTGSLKDLNIAIVNEDFRYVSPPGKIQAGFPQSPEQPNNSSYARESFVLQNLPRGRYTLRISDHSKNFTDSDRWRLLIRPLVPRPEAVTLEHPAKENEMLVPADNPNVFTVGDCSLQSAVGSVESHKPDFVIPDSNIKFTNGDAFGGTSNATALAGAAIASMLAQEPRFREKKIPNLRRYLKRLEPLRRQGKNSCRDFPVWVTPRPEDLGNLVQ